MKYRDGNGGEEEKGVESSINQELRKTRTCLYASELLVLL